MIEEEKGGDVWMEKMTRMLRTWDGQGRGYGSSGTVGREMISAVS